MSAWATYCIQWEPWSPHLFVDSVRWRPLGLTWFCWRCRMSVEIPFFACIVPQYWIGKIKFALNNVYISHLCNSKIYFSVSKLGLYVFKTNGVFWLLITIKTQLLLSVWYWAKSRIKVISYSTCVEAISHMNNKKNTKKTWCS